jgi:hypothetical protein
MNNGRPVGSRNKRDLELLDRIAKRGDRLAVDILSEIANDPKESKPLRIQAAIGVAPYQTHKLGLVPVPAPLVYSTVPPLPHAACTSVRDAIENIEFIASLQRDGRLDQATAESAISSMRLVRDGLIEEQKALIAQGGPPSQVIRIEGGMEPLPGTNIDFSSTAYAVEAARRAFPAVTNGEAVRDLGGLVPPVPVVPHPESPLAEKPGQPKHPVGDPDPEDKP